jgi:molybdopterin molybdotransferase
MTVEITQALELIEKAVTALDQEILPIEEAVGRILSEDIVACQNLPAFDNSAMDGYAVCCDIANKSFEVNHTIFAGDKIITEVADKKPLKIMTGAPIPAGCEAIVPIENVKVEGSLVTFPAEIEPGKHIRHMGEDIAVGETLLYKGEKLFGYHMALLASQGISHVKVYRRPKVAVFASGEELKMHFEQVQEHQIYNSNAPTFLARAKELGSEVRFVGSAKDSLEDIKHHIENALDADFIVTSGGVSVGDADFTREAFDAFGIERLFEKVNIKPGKPTSLGKIGKSWVINLPGNPLAALINFEIFGSKVLHKLSGNQASHLGVIHAVAKETISIRAGRVTVLPGFWDGKSFTVTEKRSPGMISPLITSNSMAILGSEVSTIEAGESIKLLSLHAVHTSPVYESMIND